MRRLAPGSLVAFCIISLLCGPARAFVIGQNATLAVGVSSFTARSALSGPAGLNSPYGVTLDASGNLWVADSNNNRVLKFMPPFINGMNASLVLGQVDFASVNSAATQSGMNLPFGLAFDSTGDLWVADRNNCRILEFAPPFSNGMNASLVLGQSSFSTGACAITQSGLTFPMNISFDASGNLWSADVGNNRVLEYVKPFSNGMNASLVLGQANFTSSATATTQNGLFAPDGPSFDAGGNLWLADTGNNRVVEFTKPFSNGMNASLVLGQSIFTTKTSALGAAGMFDPYQAIFDASGNLWISDEGNVRVLEFVPPFSNGMNASLVIGQAGFGTRNFGTTASALENPRDMVFDPAGNLWLADQNNSRLLRFSPPFSNGMSAALEIGQNFWNGAGSGAATAATFQPTMGSFDASGRLWVADGSNNRVLQFAPPFSDGMAAALALGQPGLTSNAAATTQSGLRGPAAAAADPSGNLWVADAFNNRVLEFKPPFSSGMNASLVLGQPSFVTSGLGTSQAGMNRPDAVAFDTSGNLWVGELLNHRVLEFKPPFSNGMNAALVLGQPDFTTTNTGTTQNTMSSPIDLALDSAGDLWVTDQFRVLEFAPPFSNGMNASLVLGQPNFTSSSLALTQSGLAGAWGLAFDGLGDLWVADNDNSSNNRVLEFSPPFSNGMNASSVLGQTDYVSNGAATTQAGLSFPEGLAFDSSGDLWVMDNGNNRVVEYAGQQAANVGPAGGILNFFSSAIILTFPPQAFAQTTSVTVTVPGSYPSAPSAAQPLTPTGVGFQVQTAGGVEPSGNVGLSLTYQPAQIAGLSASSLVLARYDAVDNRWVPLTSTPNPASDTVSAVANHLSTFQLMSAAAPGSVSSIAAYPNPLRPAAGASSMTFANVPAGARLRIYTVSGVLVKDLTADGSGMASWDGSNRSGAPVATGVYFVFVQGSGSEKTIKVAVQR